MDGKRGHEMQLARSQRIPASMMTHHRTAVEFFCQAMDINDDVGRIHFDGSFGSVTVTD